MNPMLTLMRAWAEHANHIAEAGELALWMQRSPPGSLAWLQMAPPGALEWLRTKPEPRE